MELAGVLEAKDSTIKSMNEFSNWLLNVYFPTNRIPRGGFRRVNFRRVEDFICMSLPICVGSGAAYPASIPHSDRSVKPVYIQINVDHL